ncbi:hypothetical protein [Francisella tularensis]|uniref:Uncharacterized protein n=3 Tax=Francisella tularensis TaxID=263 RepID=A0AAW3D3R6_FRATU|nr:hypothetical protein [Francisella tularensis]ADA79144.1 hypothetical membrane protein [Francisella tularensis subsp. tularensis NE061598]AFB79518.1 hypothetical protein FTU_1510 [Francisella tularensis subsp. tularensis TIGB03]AFB81063.1 hypothetical protein FTV_1426 [Francisella tularensis subsp. tularensis TI0902]AJI68976.1 hypothetical protein BZ14_1271 [Francisella tularensis subsp. tularensis SCHU S4]AJI72082.1 hypothetical protein CH69_1454 [Francisella tularensis subsp. tularensis]
MYKSLNTKVSGSALLMALIFSFVIMVMLTGLLYTFKMGLLTTKSIIKNNNEKVLGETYISKVRDDINFTKSTELEIGDSKFQIIVNKDDVSSFFPNNTNAELFQSQQYNSYDVIYKAFNLGTHVDLTERIIYNALVANSYQNFDGDFIPINVPMINPDAMTDYQERIYRLKSDGTIDDMPKGFIELIQKQNRQLSIFTKNAKIGVPIPEKMATDYKVKVGWNLEKGKWRLYLLLYDTDKLFTTDILLDDLLDEEKVKGLEADNEALGNQIGKWQAVISGGGREMSSAGEQFIKNGIIDVVWYFDKNDAPPELMMVRSVRQNQTGSDTKKKTSKFKKITRQQLEIYYSEYSSGNKNYVVKLADRLEFKEELNEDTVKLLVPDMASNLEANMVLIFHPNEQSKTLMGISDFNYNGDHRVGKSLDTYIDGESFGKPVIVSKSNDSMYIITFEPNKLHRYEYKKGFGSFISLEFGSNGLEKEFDFDSENNGDMVVVGLSNSKKEDDKKDAGIQLVVPKFGYLFVFTPDKVMQLNYDFEILQEIDLGVSNPQILADFDAVKNTINKIYIQSEALEVKAQEISDELGDEAKPQDSSEINDKNKSSSQNKSKPKSITERKKQELAKNNAKAKDEEDNQPAERIYLDTKYLYPLGIVKEVKL